MKTNGNILLCEAHGDVTDAELKTKMNDMEKLIALHSYKSGFYLTISGYDNDARELWQIPQVKVLSTRLVELGFISLLEVSAAAEWVKDDSNLMFGLALGSLEVWLLSKGMLSDNCSVTKHQFKLFLKALDKSNRVCNSIIGGVKK